MPATKFWIKLYNGLLEPKHVETLRDAIWVYLWMLDKKTSRVEDPAPVLYGRPITDARIAEDLGLPETTVRRWRNQVVEAGYVVQKRAPHGNRFWITKARKEDT